MENLWKTGSPAAGGVGGGRKTKGKPATSRCGEHEGKKGIRTPVLQPTFMVSFILFWNRVDDEPDDTSNKTNDE